MNKAFKKHSRMIKVVKRQKALAKVREQFDDVLTKQGVRFKLK